MTFNPFPLLGHNPPASHRPVTQSLNGAYDIVLIRARMNPSFLPCSPNFWQFSYLGHANSFYNFFMDPVPPTPQSPIHLYTTLSLPWWNSAAFNGLFSVRCWWTTIPDIIVPILTILQPILKTSVGWPQVMPIVPPISVSSATNVVVIAVGRTIFTATSIGSPGRCTKSSTPPIQMTTLWPPQRPASLLQIPQSFDAFPYRIPEGHGDGRAQGFW